jgi:AcrR family transcriptional regulator
MDAGGLEAVTLREVGRQALLAAVATKELRRREVTLTENLASGQSPAMIVRAAVHSYVAWALTYPVRFKLVFSVWTIDSPELAEAATATRRLFIESVTAAQETGALPATTDPERLTFLLLALAHGAVDLALSGHLAQAGKGKASPDDLVDDLFNHLAPS